MVNLRPINKDKSPLIMIAKTPIKQEVSPIILKKFIFSLKKIQEIKIMNIGEDEYIIPILVTVVVCPAKNGNAPQIPQPIEPIKNILLYSFFTNLKFFFKELKVNGSNNKKTIVHLQKAKEIGGTYSTPPLATIKLLAIKIG
tara:strand:- start:136 stop:561 length:426 start_codon:yes stop_codon:yes gene_type:complete